MRIILVNPPVPKFNTYGRYVFASPKLVSLGMCQISSYIKSHTAHSVEVIDSQFSNLETQGIMERLMESKPEVVGISITTSSYNQAKMLTKQIRKRLPDAIIVAGGPHVSALPEQVLEECDIDFGVIGEGEISFLGIIEYLEGKRSLDSVEGITYLNEGIAVNKQKSVIEDLDSLPYPDLDSINLKNSKHTPIRSRNVSLHLVTSRGCPFRCVHCDQAVFGNVYRAFSIDYLMKEIKYFMERYKLSSISFEDDSFSVDSSRLESFCDSLVKNRIKLNWSCSIRPEIITERLARKMKASGCTYIYIGLESGSAENLRSLGRCTDLNIIRAKIRAAKNQKLKVHGSFLIGIPTETAESIMKTISFSKDCGIDSVTFNLFTPFPKTNLREIALKSGTVSDNWDYYSDHSPVPSFIPQGFTADELISYQKKAYRSFYLNPSYIASHLDYLQPANLLSAMQAFVKLAK